MFLGYKTASGYCKEYFFQHCLMNIPFTDLNEIIHLNAESIPEYIRHFASALFVNDIFWNNVNGITHELQVEGNSDDYINSYLSYVNMLRTTYNFVTKGKSLFFLFYCYYVYYVYVYICKYIYIIYIYVSLLSYIFLHLKIKRHIIIYIYMFLDWIFYRGVFRARSCIQDGAFCIRVWAVDCFLERGAVWNFSGGSEYDPGLTNDFLLFFYTLECPI